MDWDFNDYFNYYYNNNSVMKVTITPNLSLHFNVREIYISVYLCYYIYNLKIKNIKKKFFSNMYYSLKCIKKYYIIFRFLVYFSGSLQSVIFQYAKCFKLII